jgi:hypothetical protein
LTFFVVFLWPKQDDLSPDLPSFHKPTLRSTSTIHRHVGHSCASFCHI